MNKKAFKELTECAEDMSESEKYLLKEMEKQILKYGFTNDIIQSWLESEYSELIMGSIEDGLIVQCCEKHWKVTKEGLNIIRIGLVAMITTKRKPKGKFAKIMKKLTP